MGRNIAYFYHSNNYPETRLLVALKSLKKHNPTCLIKLLVYGLDQQKMDYLRDKFNAEMIVLPKEEWDPTINPIKIRKIRDIGITYGDNVLVLDVDLFFRVDPFKIFENDFDVFVSTRCYPSPFPVESGVWGFRYGKAAETFLDFYIAQIYNPTWPPYAQWRQEYKRVLATGGWWCDQDFLCAFLLQYQIEHGGKITAPWSGNNNLERVFSESKIPFEIKLFDAGFDYDYTIGYGPDKKALFEHFFEKIHFGDGGVKIVHLRSILHQEDWLKKLGLTEKHPSGWPITFAYYSLKYSIKKVWALLRNCAESLLQVKNIRG